MNIEITNERVGYNTYWDVIVDGVLVCGLRTAVHDNHHVAYNKKTQSPIARYYPDGTMKVHTRDPQHQQLIKQIDKWIRIKTL